MNKKRMFSNDVTNTDRFLDMPATAQLLYFHLGMTCDDDGFTQLGITMRTVGASKDDLGVLVAKGFVILFATGACVITHHRRNNKFDRRDTTRTTFTSEFDELFIGESGQYTLEDTGKKAHEVYAHTPPVGFPSVSRRFPVDRIEENRIEQNRKEKKRIEKNSMATNTTPTKTKEEKNFKKPTLEEVEAYCKERDNTVNATKFVNHYTMKGWKVGRVSMKDWKAAVRTWEQTQKDWDNEKAMSKAVNSNVLDTGHIDEIVKSMSG